ncbi:Sec-independent protein translocase subunit TatA/TatB [Sphingobacterium sp. LRF_L2]|uniref:Sec-independent protein translocase subunit TatA/TatB n=1 Tax=Sphingobacterium sp. LRF_L2 TaxID=3369421 RepID=UPI003F5F112C
MTFAFMNIGTQEMILILVVVLLLFGGKKLPEMARGLGKGIREFKDASEGIKREVSEQIEKANNRDKEDLTRVVPESTSSSDTLESDPNLPDSDKKDK